MESYAEAYLRYLQQVSIRDLEKLESIALEAEEEYILSLPSPHNFGPDEIPTTQRPPLTHFETTLIQPSRCTIPLAMTCLSIIEFLGNIVSPSCNLNFQNGAKHFFLYTGDNVPNKERELLREIYRNGIMHSFFPKGIEIGITYDSSLKSVDKLFIIYQSKIILNVNYLCSKVIFALNKIVTDTAIHPTVNVNLGKVSEQEFQNVTNVIEDFKRV